MANKPHSLIEILVWNINRSDSDRVIITFNIQGFENRFSFLGQLQTPKLGHDLVQNALKSQRCGLEPDWLLEVVCQKSTHKVPNVLTATEISEMVKTD